MRYVGQEHAVRSISRVELFAQRDREGIKRQFDAAHEQRYGICAATRTPKSSACAARSPASAQAAARAHQPVAAQPPADARGRAAGLFRRRGFVDTPVYARDCLRAGNRIAGPALIEEYASTTVVLPGDALTVDAFGNLVITIGRD